MLFPTLVLARPQEPAVRTAAIYRCSQAEAESKFFEPLVEEGGYDAVCIEPEAGPNAKQITSGKVRFVQASTIDTPANLRWRNALIAFANGTISPKEWLERTKGMKETIHFLSSPKAPSLRNDTKQLSGRAVLAELTMLSVPGRVCITAGDTSATRPLPPAGPLQSWYLSMNDNLGPMLYLRAEHPEMVVGKPKIVRADSKPGLLVLSYTHGKNGMTLYLNNGPVALDLPETNWENFGFGRGLDMEQKRARLQPTGFVIVHR